MVSDPFPNQVQREIKTETLHQQLKPRALFPLNYFHLALAPWRIPRRLLTFILKEFSAVVV